MQTVLHSDSLSVAEALGRLGLTEGILLTAARQGYLARANCTANHPPLFAPFVAWGETLRALREQLATLGWSRSDDRNYSRSVRADRLIAIAVATGDEATGLASGFPCTKSAKGPSTTDALEINRRQLFLPGMEPSPPSEKQEQQMTTWLLLVHHARGEIRCELSLPLDIGDDGRISVWQERILLPSMPLDPELINIVPPTQPDIDVAVRRKA
ncbi:hypothetical protein [Burkholderia sp. PAMC 26561]|uniref:hypothetical protein n=1 Tax=Burkholderia sp. PAMC 26561 TaxID=1795043 RepID=UPI00076B2E83|nr:hypothetical protein [Burkholderia sp. PAMC 26561]AME28748.1 hypothetical protein AXG89_33685 [Burkholderia sp. PAMC 26561]